MNDLVREAAPLYERRASFWKRLSALLRLKEPVYGPIDLAESFGEGSRRRRSTRWFGRAISSLPKSPSWPRPER